MSSTPTMRFSEQENFHPEDTGQIERSLWVLEPPNPPPLWNKLFSPLKKSMFFFSSKKKTYLGRAVSFLESLFPILCWFKNYKASKFKNDLLAGLTLASLSIPQSIGYANLAKLDPQYGLYTSVVPPLIYAVMGSSREIAIGPVAVVSLLLSSLVPKVVDPAVDPDAYRSVVFTVTLFAGIFQAAFGIFRLGFLVDFLSHAALVGFMAGAAIIIGLQQLKGLLGVTHFTNKTDVISVLVSVYKSLHQQITSGEKWYPLNFVIGCSFLIFLLIARFVGRRNKKLFWLPAIAPLLSVLLSTSIVYLSKADKSGVNIIKHVKGGLNPSSVHKLQFHGPHVGQTAKIGLISAVIALTVSISFAKILIQSIRPGIEVLGQVPRTEAFCDVSQYPMATSTPGILVIRISSGSLCFANANFVRERILKWVIMEEENELAKGKVYAVILDMGNLMNVDTSGILVLEELHKRLLSRGVRLAMVNPRWVVIWKLKVAQFVDKIGKKWVFLTVGEAVDACLSSKLPEP